MKIEVGSIIAGGGILEFVALSKVKREGRTWNSLVVAYKRQNEYDILIPAGIVLPEECYVIVGSYTAWYLGECRRVIGNVDNRYLPTLKCFFEISKERKFRGW